MRLLQDNMIWKPPSGKALLAHQDAAYVPFLEPPNMTTCWMALDETAADTGTIYYARGSHAWGQLPTGDTFHAPGGLARLDARGAAARRRGRDGADRGAAGRRRVPPRPLLPRLAAQRAARRGPAGDHQPHGHDGHDLASDVRHPLYSRYMRPDDLEMDEVYFPIMWREDGYRTPYIESHFASAA